MTLFLGINPGQKHPSELNTNENKKNSTDRAFATSVSCLVMNFRCFHQIMKKTNAYIIKLFRK